MKTSAIILFLSFCLISCEENSDFKNTGPETYASDMPSLGLNYSVTLTHQGSIVTVVRKQSKPNGTDPVNSIVLNPDMKVENMTDGSVLIHTDKDDVWFVPFGYAYPPIKMVPDKCIQYYCSCGGALQPAGSGCQTNTSSNRIDCGRNGTADCLSHCVGWAFEVDCDNIAPTDPDWTDLSTGGVFVNAQEIKIIEPPQPPPLKFKYESDGSLIRIQ